MRSRTSTRRVRIAALLGIVATWTLGWVAATSAGPGGPVTRARELLETLNDEQRAQVQLAFEHEDRAAWDYVPGQRLGLSLGEMSDASRVAAHALLRSAFSSSGYLKITSIQSVLEQVLFETESRPGRPAAHRDVGRYWIAIYGEPSDEGTWAWRFEGHHVSANVTVTDGAVVSATPLFFGVNPDEVRTGPHAGLRVLGEEEELAFALLDALTDEQRAVAVTSSDKPNDIDFRPGVELGEPAETGLPASALTPAQAEHLRRYLAAWTGNLRPDLAEAALASLLAHDPATLRIEWRGETERERPYDLEVRGPGFVLELLTTGDDWHVHAVWRERE